LVGEQPVHLFDGVFGSAAAREGEAPIVLTAKDAELITPSVAFASE